MELKDELWIYEKPWLIVGKGPTFNKHEKLDLNEYNIIGLNHVVEFIHVDLFHFIDVDVFYECWDQWYYHINNIIAPYHPHTHFKVSKLTLDQYLKDLPTKVQNELYWYNLSTWKNEPHLYKEIIRARFFSAEAMFHLLCLLGIKKISSLGIDGGTIYSDYFNKYQPLTNGQTTFDKQLNQITRVCKKFGVHWKRL